MHAAPRLHPVCTPFAAVRERQLIMRALIKTARARINARNALHKHLVLCVCVYVCVNRFARTSGGLHHPGASDRLHHRGDRLLAVG